jgi:hypothetical protein
VDDDDDDDDDDNDDEEYQVGISDSDADLSGSPAAAAAAAAEVHSGDWLELPCDLNIDRRVRCGKVRPVDAIVLLFKCLQRSA